MEAVSGGRLGLGVLAMNLGFDRLLAVDIHIDLLGLGFGLLGQPDLQHALVIVGRSLAPDLPNWAA
jgi:hypothetical protein